MSTAPPVVAPVPAFAHFLNLFNQIAMTQLATAIQIESDISAGQKLQAVSDGLVGVAETFAQINPVWAPEAVAAAQVAQTGLALFSAFFSIFHHPKAAPPAPVSVPPTPVPAPAQ